MPDHLGRLLRCPERYQHGLALSIAAARGLHDHYCVVSGGRRPNGRLVDMHALCQSYPVVGMILT